MTTALTDLSAEVVGLARTQRCKIITAESCTAGALTTLLADTPGAGDILEGGIVSYAKSCKVELLGVDAELLAAQTAVSADVALAMARGALGVCPTADIAVAVTCGGGPKPDDDGNPVGLTYAAVCDRRQNFEQLKIIAGNQSSGRIRLLRSFLKIYAAHDAVSAAEGR
jgi:PncC family amidohydrolase